jgi:hypothetical protein
LKVMKGGQGGHYPLGHLRRGGGGSLIPWVNLTVTGNGGRSQAGGKLRGLIATGSPGSIDRHDGDALLIVARPRPVTQVGHDHIDRHDDYRTYNADPESLRATAEELIALRPHRSGVPAPLCHKYLSRSGAGMTIYGATRAPPKRELLTRHSRHCFDKTPVQALRSASWHAKPRKRASGGPAIA